MSLLTASSPIFLTTVPGIDPGPLDPGPMPGGEPDYDPELDPESDPMDPGIGSPGIDPGFPTPSIPGGPLPVFN